MWRFGGHLGATVSALVDGQLDPEASERAWAHVHVCPECRRLVEREGWVKRQLAAMASTTEPARPPATLLGSLYELDPATCAATRDAWAAVDELEHRSRARRRMGIAAVGLGSVSAAVLGLGTLAGGSSTPPPASLTRPSHTASPVAASSGLPTPAPSRTGSWLMRRQGADTSNAVPIRSQDH